MATLDPHGYMTITDRAKDVIKSGGEWISSIDIENFAVGHPAVAEAAVIGVRHPKWDERPLLIIVLKPGKMPRSEEILNYLEGKIAKWWMPDDVVFVDEIPHTATGKIQKIGAAGEIQALSPPHGRRHRGLNAVCSGPREAGLHSTRDRGDDGRCCRTGHTRGRLGSL